MNILIHRTSFYVTTYGIYVARWSSKKWTNFESGPLLTGPPCCINKCPICAT